MSKGHNTVTDVNSLIAPANAYREKLVVQVHTVTSGSITLGFGENAVYLQGIQLLQAGSVIAIAGALARSAVYGICNTGQSSVVGYQENLGICSGT